MAVVEEQIAHADLVSGGQTTLHSHPGGGGRYGQAVIPFANWLIEDSITVVDAGILATSKILASVYADNDEVYAQDWLEPVIRNIVPGVSFDIVLRPRIGTFKGSIKANWTWN